MTTDIWSSPSRDSFISFTAHWISANFQRKLIVLRCMRLNTEHSADNIAKALPGIASDWGHLKIHTVTRDNAINMINAARKANIESIGCYCHILHLVITHSVFQQSGVKKL